MQCKKCGSNNVSVQLVTETQMKTKHHSLLYWIFIGWWLEPILWIFLTIPMLFGKMFGRKNQKLKQKHISIAVCQDCGNRWEIR